MINSRFFSPLNKVSEKALKKPVPEPILVTEKEIFNKKQFLLRLNLGLS